MAVYLVKRKNRNKRIVKFDFDAVGFEFKPNIHKEKFIKISNLYILNEKMINQILVKKHEKSFRRLAAITLSVVEDGDATSGDAIIALNEIEKQKNIIMRKHHQYLKKEEEKKCLKRLAILEKQLKDRLEILNYEYEEEQNFTR